MQQPNNPTERKNDLEAVRKVVMSEFLPDFKPTLESEIYFALARIVASHELRTEATSSDTSLNEKHLEKARREAQETVTYAIGAEACFADFGHGNQEQLQNLFSSVAKIIDRNNCK